MLTDGLLLLGGRYGRIKTSMIFYSRTAQIPGTVLTSFMQTPESSGEYPRQQTTTTLSEATAKASQLDPEFCDFRGLDRLFGIKRSLGYQLLADGLIKSVSLRRRGQIRGKRLFSVDSVRAYLREQMANQKGREAS